MVQGGQGECSVWKSGLQTQVAHHPAFVMGCLEDISDLGLACKLGKGLSPNRRASTELYQSHGDQKRILSAPVRPASTPQKIKYGLKQQTTLFHRSAERACILGEENNCRPTAIIGVWAPLYFVVKGELRILRMERR